MYYFSYIPKGRAAKIGRLHLFSDDKALHVLCFNQHKNQAIQTLGNPKIINKRSKIIDKTIRELDLYFQGKLKKFTVPLSVSGTKFQKATWKGLLRIPYGKIVSYKTQGEMIANPAAVRAIGTANSKNPISIIIPCHRVVPMQFSTKRRGGCGGYGGGTHIKECLLRIESVID